LAGETGTVEVDWDLTNLGEDYGGLWPHPVADFDHFCVRVELVTNDDNDCNSCNNMAQHNFFDVATAPGAFYSTMMIVANPFDTYEDWMELQLHAALPKNWLVVFDGDPQPPRIFLNPRHKKAVKVGIDVPDEPLIEWPIDGTLVGEVRGSVGGRIQARLDQAVRTGGDEFEGELTGRLEDNFVAQFEAKIAGIIIDPATGELEGKLWGMAYELKTGEPIEMDCHVRGRLTPERRVSVSGRIRGLDVGGVDFYLAMKR
jgi:hypothetical protein